jgi:hypothetical protein
VLEKVQGAERVRVAVPVIEAVVDSELKGQGNLLVLGVDMTGDRSLRDYDLDSGEDAVSTTRWSSSRSPTRSCWRRSSPTGTSWRSVARCRSARSRARSSSPSAA